MLFARAVFGLPEGHLDATDSVGEPFRRSETSCSLVGWTVGVIEGAGLR